MREATTPGAAMEAFVLRAITRGSTGAPVLLLPVILLWCSGCPATGRLPTQAPVLDVTEEQTQRPYLLFVPSTYSDRVSWPLVVACHELRIRCAEKFAVA